MSEAYHFNDSPITIPREDKFGADAFAKAIAKSIRDMKTPIGVTLAINGKWGAGKSSVLNLIRHHLATETCDPPLKIIDFQCWWFRGEEALTIAFLQELYAALEKTLGEQAKDLIPKLGQLLLQTGPVVGPAVSIATGGLWGAISGGSLKLAERLLTRSESIEDIFKKLSGALQQQSQRFVVIIDDIDRLNPEESLLIFRLVKSVGRLPNVLYILSFDRDIAERAISDRYPSEGPHFLEKIVQASIDVPIPPRNELTDALVSQVEEICGPPADQEAAVYFMNIFYDVVSHYLETPRDLVRIRNSMSISWPAIAGEVNVADYLALEVIRLFEPKLFDAIRHNKDNVCDRQERYGMPENRDSTLELLLKAVPDERKAQCKAGLQRLFPRLENVGYAPGFIEIWERRRQVCTSKHFDTYFQLALGEGVISDGQVADFISNCGDQSFVERWLRSASQVRDKRGKSRIPALLDELNLRASEIDKRCFQPLVSALFHLADEIDLDEDAERGFQIGDTWLRIHWLVRKLTVERCSLDERSHLFVVACEEAALGWLINFTESAANDYFPSEGQPPAPPEKCLVSASDLERLKHISRSRFIASSLTNELVYHRRLAQLLFGWKRLNKDSDAVEEWIESLLQDDVSVAKLAKAFTTDSWAQSAGDRVAFRTVRASVDSLNKIMDVQAFRENLERIEKSGSLEETLLRDVSSFLNAWKSQEKRSNSEEVD